MVTPSLNVLLPSMLVAFVGSLIISTYASPVLDARQTTSLPSGWSAIGCYSDVPSSRTLKIASYTDVSNMTIESCLAFCTPSGYKYAGVEFARECYCDNAIESPGAPISSATCNMPCTGNQNEICGGAGGIDIFLNANTATTPPPPPPSTGTIKQTAGTFQYKGCYQDGVNGAPRSLRNQLSVSGGVTAESCTAACKAAGYVLSGLEFAQECWCDFYMPLAVSTPDTDCNMVCKADSTELCGAGNRLAIYQDSSVPPLSPQQCLTSTQLQSTTFKFGLFAAPSSGGGAPIGLANNELPAHIEQASIQIITNFAENLPHTYSIGSDVNGGASSISVPSWDGFGSAFSIQPTTGGALQFAEPGTGPAPPLYSQYCAQPNPSSSGTYIGPPVLAVNGRSDQWSFCSNFASVLFSPTPGPCPAILLEMTQPIL